MSTEFAEYDQYFHTGLRVEIGIRMPNRDIFREWAIVQGYQDDLIEVKLSRDVLPANVKFDLGSIVDVGVWVRDQVYTCNAIVVEKNGAVDFLIRLLSSVTLKERREFFRLGVSLRMRYAFPVGMTGGEIRIEWQKRAELEHLKVVEGVSNYLHSPYIVSKWAHLKPSGPEPVWVESLDMPATISGSGIRFLLPEPPRIDEKIYLELYLPLMPARVVHLVAEVIHVMEPVRASSGPKRFYPTGMRFVYLEERDRDLIIKYISAEQMEQLRKLSDSLRFREESETAPLQAPRLYRVLRVLLLCVLLGLAIWLFYGYYEKSRHSGVKNEIEDTYGRELGKYRHKRNITDQ